MSVDPIALQVTAGALRAACEEMGAVLVRSAHSANIKERRDCSTAVFDPRGRMIAQAEHIPVHLGAMPDAVAAVRAHDPAPGEAWILNDPFAGGTHLPDITLITRTRVGFAVTRAHHADVGGIEPAEPASAARTRNGVATCVRSTVSSCSASIIRSAPPGIGMTIRRSSPSRRNRPSRSARATGNE